MNKKNLDIIKKIGHGFNTPEGYFESIEDDVLSKLSVKKFPLKEGFTIPSNYFETVEATVFETLSAETDSKKQPLNVPEGYFDTIEDRVFSKLQNEKVDETKVIDLRSRFLKIVAPVAIAASLLLIFTLNSTSDSYTLDDLAASDIEAWIEDDLISLDSYEIAEVYNDVKLEDEFSDDDLEVLEYINGTDIESALLTD